MRTVHVFKRMSFFAFEKDHDYLELSVLKLSSKITFFLQHAFQEDLHGLSNAAES